MTHVMSYGLLSALYNWAYDSLCHFTHQVLTSINTLLPGKLFAVNFYCAFAV